ncbi:MAG: hypothetical protein ACLQFM_00480 [Terriglobales bacterium]
MSVSIVRYAGEVYGFRDVRRELNHIGEVSYLAQTGGFEAVILLELNVQTERRMLIRSSIPRSLQAGYGSGHIQLSA